MHQVAESMQGVAASDLGRDGLPILLNHSGPSQIKPALSLLLRHHLGNWNDHTAQVWCPCKEEKSQVQKK